MCDTAETLREAVTVMCHASALGSHKQHKEDQSAGGSDIAAQPAEPVILLCGGQLEVVSQFVFVCRSATFHCTMDAEI